MAENAMLLGSPHPEAGYCAHGVQLRPAWEEVSFDYKESDPLISTFKLSLNVGLESPAADRITCNDIEHAQLRRRWQWNGLNAWCSIVAGPLKGWEWRIKEAILGGDSTYVWANSPEWMKDGGHHGPAWKYLREQGKTLP